MSEAMGPIFVGGFQTVTKSGYTIVFLPDIANPTLQKEGKPAVYYWMPNEVRLARRDNGDFKFSLLHFCGLTDGTDEQSSGGLFAFSTTSAIPASVLEEATNDLINRFKGSDEHYWGWRTPAMPMIRPIPIVGNTTTVTNLSPDSQGLVPTAIPNPSVPRGTSDRLLLSRPPFIRAMRQREESFPQTYSMEKAIRGTRGLDTW